MQVDIQILDWIFYTALFTILFPIIILAHNFKYDSRELKALLFLFLVSFACDAAAELFFRFRIAFVNLAGIIYNVIGPLFFGYFFYHCLGRKRFKSIVVVTIGVSVFALINALFIQKRGLNTMSSTVDSLYVLTFCVAYYYKLVMELPARRIQDIPMFWFISGFLFAHAGKFVIVSVAEYMATFQNDNLVVLWSMFNFLAIVGNIAATWGAWLHARQMKRIKSDPVFLR